MKLHKSVVVFLIVYLASYSFLPIFNYVLAEPIIDTTGLELQWWFNDGSGTTAADGSSNSLDGTLNNMEAGDWVTDFPQVANNSYSLDFDGVDESVSVSDPAGGELDTTDEDFTITAWFNRDNTGERDTIIAKKTGPGVSHIGYSLEVQDTVDAVEFCVVDNSIEQCIFSTTTFGTGPSGWHHVAAVYDEDFSMSIYIDGQLDRVIGIGSGSHGSFANSADFYVGEFPDGSNPFNGKIDDVRFYRRKLPDNEIATLTGTAPGGVKNNLSLWLRGDVAATAAQWDDQSGSSNNATQGTAVNQPTITSNAINFNDAVTFDNSTGGQEDFYSLDPTLLPNGTSARSYYFVANPSGSPGSPGLFMHGGAGNGQKVDFTVQSGDTDIQVNSHEYGMATGYSVPTIYGFHIGASANSDAWTLDVNGAAQTLSTQTGSATGVNTGTTEAFVGSAASALTSYFNGDVGEVIVYEDLQFTGNSRDKIETYLSIKYGVPIDQTTGTDLIASDDSEIWDKDATDASTYDNDIAGIGRDDVSGLNQTRSRSESGDGIFDIGTPTDLGELEYMTWGNDDGNATGWISQGTPAGFYRIGDGGTQRQWMIQENNGDVGSVTVTIDEADIPIGFDDLFLAVDTDADKDLSDETEGGGGLIPMTDGGTTWTASHNFTDSQMFALMYLPKSPGGVAANIKMWLRSDAGTSTTTDGANLTSWTDSSGNNNGVTATGGNEPTYESDTATAINKHPVIEFTAANNDFLATSNTGIIGADNPYTKVVLFEKDANTEAGHLVSAGSSGNHGLYYPASNDAARGTHNATDFATSGTNQTNGQPYIAAFRYGDGIVDTVLNINGAEEANDGITSRTFTDGGTIEIGQYSGAGTPSAQNFDGRIAEVLVYDEALTGAELDRIESYYGLKYGITLDQAVATSYTASDGVTLMWNSGATDASTYDNDIAGIGRDGGSDLTQNDSKSVNGDAIVNISGADDLDELEFMTWGNDDGAVTWTPSDAPSGYQIITRKWGVQENNGDVGNVLIEIDVEDADLDIPGIPGSNQNYYFVFDSDNDGNLSDEMPIIMYDNGTNGDVSSGDDIWTAQNINLNDGTEFTLASIPTAPGGVANNLGLWLKGDAGLDEADSADVDTWADQSGLVRDFADGGGVGRRPTYHFDTTNATDQINFNPVLQFQASQDDMLTYDNVSDRLFSTSDASADYSFFGVSRTVDTDGVLIAQFGDTSDGDRFGLRGGTNNRFWKSGGGDVTGTYNYR